MNSKTVEYKTLQSNFDRLTTGVSSSVRSVARKAFQNKLITIENMSSALNELHSERSRSDGLMVHILNKVDENKYHFYMFISILKSVSTLTDLADSLAKECSESSNKEASGSTLDDQDRAVPLQSRRRALSDNALLSFQCKCGNNCTLESCLSGECRGQLENAFPYLDITHLCERDRDKLIRRLVIEANEMIIVFEDLVYEAFESLKEQDTPVDELRKVVLNFGPQSLPRLYNREHREQLSNAKTVNDVHAFLTQHNYISFFNYRILQRIIKFLGKENDKKKLGEYKKKYGEFCKRRVFEIPTSTLANSSPELDKTLVVKVNEKVWFGSNRKSPECEFTMHDVYAVEHMIAREIGIHPENILLKDVEKGCIQLGFVVLSQISTDDLNVKLKGLMQFGIQFAKISGREVTISSRFEIAKVSGRGTAYYQCPANNCRHKWKVRNSSGMPKECPECGKKDIKNYKFSPKKYVTLYSPPPRERRMFGDFDCDCGNSWKSAHTWVTIPGYIACWQLCRSCDAKVYPTNFRPLLYSGSSSNQTPHDSARCQKCIECGGDCLSYVPPEPAPDDVVDEDEDDDDLSVISAASSISGGDEEDRDLPSDGDRTPVDSDTDEFLTETLGNLHLRD